MAGEFKTIETQEAFDEAIKDRLARERATLTKQYDEKYADYDQIKKERDDFSTQVEGFQKTAKENAEKITDLGNKLAAEQKKSSGFELENMKTQIAIDKGLPMDLRGRLNGTTKEELEKDADSLLTVFRKQNNKNIPGFEQNEGNAGDSKENQKKAALLKVAKQLKEGE